MNKRRLSRLPAWVHLGRGYKLRVVLVTPTQMQDLLDEDELGGTAACWDDDTYTISVDNTLSRSAQWEAYFHELYHAVHDIAERNRGKI